MTKGADLPDDADLTALLDKISREAAFACASYKPKYVRRRLAVRMRARGVATYADYAALLDAESPEFEKLLDALTINVTKLCRNWATYAAIQGTVIPSLWARPDHLLNVWSAGSASGEEAYSLGVLFHRYLRSIGEVGRASRIRILGTDIDRDSLTLAERGTYGAAAFTETPPELRTSYFSVGLPATVAAEVRSLVRFRRHDIIRDDAPTGQHLITCRNVIIYFDRPTQELLFERFHTALAPGGFLVLGKVETLLGDWRSRFTAVDARERIFQRA
jgi:chemotaxis protein methyltransferase CheR